MTEYYGSTAARAFMKSNLSSVVFDFTDGTQPSEAFTTQQKQWLYDCFLDALETMPEDED